MRCEVHEGGGAYDDYWLCKTCEHGAYPESFECPHGQVIAGGAWSLPDNRNPWVSEEFKADKQPSGPRGSSGIGYAVCWILFWSIVILAIGWWA